MVKLRWRKQELGCTSVHKLESRGASGCRRRAPAWGPPGLSWRTSAHHVLGGHRTYGGVQTQRRLPRSQRRTLPSEATFLTAAHTVFGGHVSHGLAGFVRALPSSRLAP